MWIVLITKSTTLNKGLLTSKTETIKQQRKKIYKTRNTILESKDCVIFRANSTSITLSITDIGWIILPRKTGIACALSLGNKVLHKLIINKENKYKKKQYEGDEQTKKSTDKLYRKSWQDNIINKIEYEALCNTFNKCLEEAKNKSLLLKWT